MPITVYAVIVSGEVSNVAFDEDCANELLWEARNDNGDVSCRIEERKLADKDEVVVERDDLVDFIAMAMDALTGYYSADEYNDIVDRMYLEATGRKYTTIDQDATGELQDDEELPL